MTTERTKAGDQFTFRIKNLHDFWITHRDSGWGNAESLAFPLGKVDDNCLYKKTSALHLYLSGMECENSAFICTADAFIIVSSQEKIKTVFNPMVESMNKESLPVTLHTFGYVSKFVECRSKVESLLSAGNVKSVGMITKEQSLYENEFGKDFTDMTAKFTVVDVSDGTTDLLAPKDAWALDSIQKASKITSKWMSHCFISELEQLLDQEKKVTHSSFSLKVESLVKNPKEYKLNANAKNIDSCYTPIIQSGGKYDLKPSAISNDDHLSADTIVCSMGAKYKNYCANVSRTFFVDPPKQQEQAYNVINKAFTDTIKAMKTGTSLKELREIAINSISEKSKDFLPHLTGNSGCGIGLQFRETGLNITTKSTKQLETNMVFYVGLGVQNLEIQFKDGKKKIYSILLGDTVLVTPGGGKVLTTVTKEWNDVYYTFKDDTQGIDDDLAAQVIDMSTGRQTRNQTRNNDAVNDAQRDKRRDHQLQLIKQKQKQNLKNRSAQVEEEEEVSYENVKDLVAYKGASEYPHDVKRTRIYVDKDNEVIFVPINGLPVPLHILTIKNISKTEGEDHSLLRINFHIPSSVNMKGIDPIMAKALQNNQLATYIKTINIKFYDSVHLDHLAMSISECLKKIKQRVIDSENKVDLVEQDNLIMTRSGRPPMLRELNARPYQARKANGILEAHENGFRFRSQKGETIDILYGNIQHAIFQKCDKTNLLVLLHFHLKNPIMIGKKKCPDVQFYSEAADSTINVDGNRRSAYDADEVEEEQRELRFRKRLNAQFRTFIDQVEHLAENRHLEFEKPYNIGFSGVPDREMVYIQPTDSCLVNLTSVPFFVISLQALEHVHFERVISGTKEFDMCLIFKDHTIPVSRISSIAMEKLDIIEQWLDNIDMTFTEGIANLNWKLTIHAADEPDFWEDRDEDGNPKAIGWMGLDMTGGAGDESGAEDSENESEYSSADQEDEESGSEEEDDDEDAELDEEEEVDDEDESARSEEGDDWDELARKAEEDDRNALKRERNVSEVDKYRQVKKRR